MSSPHKREEKGKKQDDAHMENEKTCDRMAADDNTLTQSCETNLTKQKKTCNN